MTMVKCLEQLDELISDLCWKAEQAEDDKKAELFWDIAERIEKCFPKDRKVRIT